MAIFFNFQTTSNHLHPLQVENCDSNSRLVVDEDDKGESDPISSKRLFRKAIIVATAVVEDMRTPYMTTIILAGILLIHLIIAIAILDTFKPICYACIGDNIKMIRILKTCLYNYRQGQLNQLENSNNCQDRKALSD